jgi:hypothetical protein
MENHSFSCSFEETRAYITALVCVLRVDSAVLFLFKAPPIGHWVARVPVNQRGH